MAKDRKAESNKRKHRTEPARTAPHRSARGHMERNAKPPNDSAGAHRSEGAPEPIADTVRNTIAGVVDLGYGVVERQIREGRDAADRLRAGLATSPQLNTNINNLVEGLVATTRDVGATWLDLLSIVLRSVGPQSACSAPSTAFGQTSTTRSSPSTTTRTGTSGAAKTVSSITPIDPAGPHEPPLIEVASIRVKSVMLHLQPPSIEFMPLVLPLAAGAPSLAPLTGVKFELSADHTRAVLKVNVSRDQPAGTYTGVIVDSRTNEPGGTVSVTVGG